MSQTITKLTPEEGAARIAALQDMKVRELRREWVIKHLELPVGMTLLE